MGPCLHLTSLYRTARLTLSVSRFPALQRVVFAARKSNEKSPSPCTSSQITVSRSPLSHAERNHWITAPATYERSRKTPWPPPAASPRCSASPRCLAACPAPGPPSSAAPRFHGTSRSRRRTGRPAARARRRSQRSSRLRRKRQWAKVEDKYAVATIGVAALIALWTAVGAVKAIDTLPILPGVFELVGIGYTGWFTYRNLIFQPDREALVSKIKSTYSEITGGSS